MKKIKAEVKNLTFTYNEKGPENKRVLNSINLPVYENSVTALIGPSGCGKTLLACAIAGVSIHEVLCIRFKHCIH